MVISVYFSFLHQLLTDLHNLTEILLKAVLNTINLALYLSARFFYEEIFNFEKNRIVFQWNPYCTVWRCYLMQIKKSTCPRTGRKWLSNVWNMPWVLHVKVTLEQCLMSNGLLGHWWLVAVQIVHSISFSPLVTKCSLYPIISPYGKMLTITLSSLVAIKVSLSKPILLPYIYLIYCLYTCFGHEDTCCWNILLTWSETTIKQAVYNNIFIIKHFLML